MGAKLPHSFALKLPATQETEFGGSVDLLMTALIGQGRLSAKQLKELYETLEQMEGEE